MVQPLTPISCAWRARTATLSLAGLVGVAGLTGCVNSREPGAPIYLGIHAFEGPRADERGDFIVSYDPWRRHSVDHVTARGGTKYAASVDDVVIRCRNVKCTFQKESRRLTVESPPEELAQIEITMQKEGYEPVELRIPVTPDNHDHDVLVLLTPSSAK